MLPQQGHSEAMWARKNSELSFEDPGGPMGSRGDRMSCTNVELRGGQSKELGMRLLRSQLFDWASGHSPPCSLLPGVVQ